MGGDCDDSDATTNPGAEVSCSTADKNCDGSPDTSDLDGDGYLGCDGDCNDGNASINPGADEVCDGIDNDCDGAIDDADSAIVGGSTFYLDDDSDGYGDVSSTTIACVKPTGYVANSDDCDDANASVNPTLLWYLDSDNDGYGTTSTTTSCLKPAGYTDSAGDCNDGDSTVFPSATERCDGQFNNCSADG